MLPTNEIRGIARTVIEATSPALQPVEALRRFVVKSRVDVVMAPLADLGGKAVGKPARTRPEDDSEAATPQRTSQNRGAGRTAAS